MGCVWRQELKGGSEGVGGCPDDGEPAAYDVEGGPYLEVVLRSEHGPDDHLVVVSGRPPRPKLPWPTGLAWNRPDDVGGDLPVVELRDREEASYSGGPLNVRICPNRVDGVLGDHAHGPEEVPSARLRDVPVRPDVVLLGGDRKCTRLNSSH